MSYTDTKGTNVCGVKLACEDVDNGEAAESMADQYDDYDGQRKPSEAVKKWQFWVRILFLLCFENGIRCDDQVSECNDWHANYKENLPWSCPHEVAWANRWEDPNDADEDWSKFWVDRGLWASEDVDHVHHEDIHSSPSHEDLDKADAEEGFKVSPGCQTLERPCPGVAGRRHRRLVTFLSLDHLVQLFFDVEIFSSQKLKCFSETKISIDWSWSMARSFVQYWAICNNDNLSNSKKIPKQELMS